MLADVDRTTDPVATARLLPPAVYTSRDFWEFEKEAIFHREWLCVGHVNEVPEPGDQLPLTILDEPIVMLRDLGGHIRVMSAVCGTAASRCSADSPAKAAAPRPPAFPAGS